MEEREAGTSFSRLSAVSRLESDWRGSGRGGQRVLGGGEDDLEGELGQSEDDQVGGGEGEVRHGRLPGAAVQGRVGGDERGNLDS